MSFCGKDSFVRLFTRTRPSRGRRTRCAKVFLVPVEYAR